MLFVPLTLKSKERCGYRTISFGGVYFHSACAGSHSESCGLFRNCESTRSLCSKLLSCSCICIWGKLEIGNTNDRTTMIDLGNFLKPRDRLVKFDCHSVKVAGFAPARKRPKGR